MDLIRSAQWIWAPGPNPGGSDQFSGSDERRGSVQLSGHDRFGAFSFLEFGSIGMVDMIVLVHFDRFGAF